jgi:hypothetical protein
VEWQDHHLHLRHHHPQKTISPTGKRTWHESRKSLQLEAVPHLVRDIQPGIFFHEGLFPAAILRAPSNQAALPYTELLYSTPTPWLVMAAIPESFSIRFSRLFFMPCRSRVVASASPLIFNHPPDMSTTSSHPHVQDSSQVHKARTVSLPFLSLSLFITAMSVCGIFCPDVVGIADAQATPSVIHIGALVSYETFIGRAAIKAIKMALDDINKDKTLLNTSVLALHLLDTNCSAFTGVAAGKHTHAFPLIRVISICFDLMGWNDLSRDATTNLSIIPNQYQTNLSYTRSNEWLILLLFHPRQYVYIYIYM